jgi:electron transfer flavoprotein beta subunit
MKIIVPVQLVPDLVEELVIDKKGKALELDSLAWILNEFDDHAIEQAILIKEGAGAEVIVAAAGDDQADDPLFAAAAKGADKLVKVAVEIMDEPVNNHALARVFKPIIEAEKPDLVFTGVSNHNGTDGALGALLAEALGFPYVGYVSGVKIEGGKAIVLKDYPGGLKAKIEVSLPAVLGISSSEKPPRYVPVSKVRQAMKTNQIKEEEGEIDMAGGLEIEHTYAPEATGKAEMLKGGLGSIAERIIEIIKEQGLF